MSSMAMFVSMPPCVHDQKGKYNEAYRQKNYYDRFIFPNQTDSARNFIPIHVSNYTLRVEKIILFLFRVNFLRK